MVLESILSIFITIPIVAFHYPIQTFIIVPLLILLVRLLYRISPLHPLGHIPSPILPRLSSLYLTYHANLGDEARLTRALHQRYGPIVRTGPNSVDIADGTALQSIYVEKGGFAKADFYANFDIDGHKSIFSEVDPSRRIIRAKAVLPLFSSASLRKGQTTINACVDRFVGRLRDESQTKSTVNLLNLTRGLAVDAVSAYLFGRRYGGLDINQHDKIERAAVTKEVRGISPQESQMSASGMVDSFVAVGRYWYLPSWLFGWVEKAEARLYPDAHAENSMAVVDEFVNSVVDHAKTDTGIDSSLLSYPARLLQAGMTVAETRAQCKDLIFAGTDSTAMNLATICWLLVKNPTCYTKLREEILTAMPSDDDLQSLPYLRGVVKEGLRLSMANPSRLPRVVPAGGWTFKGTFFPAGTVVSCTPYVLHLTDNVFEDPWTFKPERWAKPSEEMLRDAIPFGLGTRQCIARNLATMELFAAVHRLVEEDVLNGARCVEDKIEILEWFNSKVVGEKIELTWD